MTFDPQLSEAVSLSEVLDELLRSNEDPDTVMSFLKDCGSSLPDVISRSICASKIPNLDFFLKLKNLSGRKLFLKLVNDFMVGPAESWLFVMQVASLGKDSVKNLLGLDQSEICNRAALLHPIPRLVRGNCLDALFLEPGSSIYYVAEKINGSKNDDLDALLVMCSPFLFEGRLCQEDLFLLSDLDKRFVILRNLMQNTDKSVCEIHGRFVLQLLCGNDDDVKFTIASSLRNRTSWCRYSWEETLGMFSGMLSLDNIEKIDATRSFPELYMEFAPFGMENAARGILIRLLMTGRDDMIVEFAENEPELVERYLPVANVAKRFLNYSR